MMKQVLLFLQASLILVIGSLGAMTSHWFAHYDADIRFTFLGFLIAVLSGMYYGLQVPNHRMSDKTTVKS
ncbi:MAG: hypothetical protein ACW98K_06425 [Candidatus Kariarchaeaceae archaeon]